MSHRWTGCLLLAGFAFVLGGWDCGTSQNPDGGPPPASACDLQSAFAGPCLATLTGAADFSFGCKPIYAKFDPTVGPHGTSSMVQIGTSNAKNPDGGVGVGFLNITLSWDGPPTDNTTPTLTPATAASKPNNILMSLSNGSDYQAVYPDQAMQFTVVKAAEAPSADGGPSSFFCIEGHLTSDVPSLSNPSSIVHLDLSFDAGI